MIVRFDPVAEVYDETRYLPAQVQEELARLLCAAAELATGSVLLDAGAGTGRISAPIGRLGVRLLALDASRPMLDMLGRKLDAAPEIRAGRCLADLRELPVRSSSVPAVLMTHVLHLIEEWQTVLQEARRALLAGGALLLVWESSALRPANEEYGRRVMERGVPQDHPGARSGEVIRWLEQSGARVEPLETRRLRWEESRSIGSYLDLLERKTWSSLWTVPDEIHRAVMEEVRAWAEQQYISMDAVESSERWITAVAARWL